MEFDDDNFDHDQDYYLENYPGLYGMSFPEHRTIRALLSYSPPVLLALGTFGNVLSAVILWRMLHKFLSTCLYAFTIVLMDLGVLYFRCGNDWLKYMVNVDVREIAMVSSKSACKIYPFVSDFVLHLTIWLTVAMAIETTIVNMVPARLIKVCLLERARAVILLIIVLTVCIDAHCFWSFALIKEEKSTYQEEKCTTKKQGNQQSEEFRKIVWPVLDILIADFVPYFVVFSCSVIMITIRFRRKDRMSQLEGIWRSRSVDAQAAMQCQTSFLFIFICYLFSMLPKLACDIFAFLIQRDNLALVKNNPDLEAKKKLSQTVVSLLLYIFVSCKFLVFLLTSRKFRDEFWSLILCRCTRPLRHPPPSRPQSSQPLLNKHNSAKPCPANCTPLRTEYSMTSV